MTGADPERLSIEGPAGAIEAIVEDPGALVTPYALVCHPHPLHGGTMHNKVVTTVARALLSCGVATIRFNFRGVGASDGVFDGGRGEAGDAAAVADWGRARWPGRALVAGGFSFGAYVAMRLAQSRGLERLILIAPPVTRFDFSMLAPPRCPWLIVQGDADDVVDAAAVESWARASAAAPRLVMLAGAGHFFHGRLLDLRDAVCEEIRSG